MEEGGVTGREKEVRRGERKGMLRMASGGM